jgi:AraC-like DNA-binding protein
MSRVSQSARRRDPSPPAVPLYAMAGYTNGLRKPGHFHLLRFEEGQSGRIDRFVPHCHDFFEMIWLPAGRGQVRSDLQSFPLEPRTVFFAAPGQVHAWQFTAPPEGEIVSFTHDFFMVNSENPGFFGRLPFLRAGATEPILRLDAAEGARMDALFRELRLAAADPAPGRDDMVRAYLTIMLTLVRRVWLRGQAAQAKPEPREGDTLACRFRLALEENFPRMLAVRDYAELLHVSRSHLNEELRRQSGQSASEIIRERVLLESKRLLVHSSLTISEIAYRLHFRDPSYFGRFFRKCSGRTPGMYREGAQHDLLAS